MKMDGKEIARQALAKKAENDKLKSEGAVVQKDIESTGTHYEPMQALIEAIHSKDPDAAHKHMMAYAACATK